MSNTKFDFGGKKNRSSKRGFNDFYEDEEYSVRDYQKDLERKKAKRLQNAIRSKDINKLIEVEEDEWDD